MRRSLRLTFAAAAVAAGLAAVPATQASPRPVQRRVSIRDFKFHPARIVVSRGTRIVWKNADSDPHTITSKSARWSSQALDQGQTFARVVHRAGTFTYICSIHPYMHGVVVVRP